MTKLTTWLLSIIGILVVSGGIGSYSWFSAEYLDEGSYLTTETIEPDFAVRIQTTGDDLRLYGYTPPTMQHMQCVFVAGTNKGDNSCFLKPGYTMNGNQIHD